MRVYIFKSNYLLYMGKMYGIDSYSCIKSKRLVMLEEHDLAEENSKSSGTGIRQRVVKLRLHQISEVCCYRKQEYFRVNVM